MLYKYFIPNTTTAIFANRVYLIVIFVINHTIPYIAVLRKVVVYFA